MEPKPDDYATDGVHIISFDRATQVMDAAISALQHYRSSGGGSVLLIDANKDMHSEWNRRLSQIGITCDTQADVVGSTSAVQAILRFLSISYGQDAWSITKLFDIIQSQAFPILENLFLGLEHPIQPLKDIQQQGLNFQRIHHVLFRKESLVGWN